jgi:hypothetical protein
LLFRNVNIDPGIADCLVVWKGTPMGMMRVAAVFTLALAVILAALAYEQDKGSPLDVSPPANNSDMPNVKLPSGWSNAGSAEESINNAVDAEPSPAAVPAAPVDSGTTVSQSNGHDISKATSGDDANGGGWGTSESNATGGSDNGGSDSSATSGDDTGDSDSGANGADDSAGASEMSNGSGDSDSNASGDSDSNTTSDDSSDSNTDSGGGDASSSDSGDASGWK